jgi:hypothetical protein
MRILGIDPGESTGASIVEDGILKEYSHKNGDDLLSIKYYIENSAIDLLVIENQFRFVEKLCRRRFTWEIYAMELGIPVKSVYPQTWYGKYHIKAGDKSATIEYVKRNYGVDLLDSYSKKEASDVADSIMLAFYGWDTKGDKKYVNVAKKTKNKGGSSMGNTANGTRNSYKTAVQQKLCRKTNRKRLKRGDKK